MPQDLDVQSSLAIYRKSLSDLPEELVSKKVENMAATIEFQTEIYALKQILVQKYGVTLEEIREQMLLDVLPNNQK